MLICAFQIADVFPEFLSVFYWQLVETKLFFLLWSVAPFLLSSIKSHCVFNESVNLYVSYCGPERQFLSMYLLRF